MDRRNHWRSGRCCRNLLLRAYLWNLERGWLLKTILLSLILASLPAFGQVEKQVSEALEKIFLDHATNKVVEPSSSLRNDDPTSSLRGAISVAFWNSVSGTLSENQLKLLREQIAFDDGTVARALFARGFNYLVLVELRRVVKYDPHKVDYGVIDVAGIANVPSGVPEFIAVDTSQWKTEFTGILKIMYRADIAWVMEQARTKVFAAVNAAGTVSHSPLNLFVDRHAKAEELLDFFSYVERTLTQYQSLLAVIQVRKAQAGNKDGEFDALTKNVERGLENMMRTLKGVLAANVNRRAAWSQISKSLRANQGELTSLENEMAAITSQTIDQIDKITGNTATTAKYSKDEVPELVLKLKQHSKEFAEIQAEWEKISEYEYHDRTHTWEHKRYHREEHGPRMYRGSDTRSRDIPGIEMAPIIEEGELALFLLTAVHQLTEAKLQAPQILEIRRRILERQQAHARYVSGGPIIPRDMHPNQKEGFEARFTARNALLSKWMDAVIDTSYRHESHERKGYVGIQFETALTPEHQAILAKLKSTARKFYIARNILLGTAGTAAAAGACYIFLLP